MSEIPRNFKAHPFDYHQIVEMDIVRLDRMGQGMGEVDGWPVWVGFVLEGERVRARVWNNQKDHSLADLVEVVTPSPKRVEPKCALFGACSGCQYQHLRYVDQLELKQGQLGELYAEVLSESIEVAGVLPSPCELGYRSKITPHYRRPNRDESLSWEQRFPIGFVRAGMKRLLDVPQCPIATDAINQVLPNVRAEISATSAELKREATALLRDTASGEVITNPKAIATEDVCGVKYDFVAGEFFQVNRSILPAFADLVVSFVRTPFLVDAYCGVGFFALQAASRGLCQQVAGVEISAKAVEFATANALKNRLDGVSFIEGRAEAIFQNINFEPDQTTVLMDPSRKGASEEFLEQLVQLGPVRVVYVACDPSTQARDVKWLLAHGYKLVHLQGMDLFPQTRHLESLAVLERV